MVLPPLPPGADPALLLAPASTTGTMSAIGDLPRGKFVYPVRRRSNLKVVVIVGLLVAAGAGFVIATKVFPRDHNATAAAPPIDPHPSPPVTLPETRPPEPTPPAVAPPDAAEIDAPPAEIVIDQTEAATPAPPKVPVAAKVPPKVAAKTPGKTPTPPPAHPAVATAPPPGPPTPPTPPTPPAPPAGPVDPDCDEVACVLEHYGRPCCERFKPAAKGPSPSAGGLDRAAVRAGVDKVKAVVIGCGEKTKVKGTVKLSVSVGSDGRVEDVTVKETPDPTLGDCVAGAVRRATFAKTPGGGSFTYPFVF
jgi:hypothetical protein